ncbi:SGNH/GDSL hydrolase family protein [Nocardia callitridis]|uniref:SGNH/GDSL hydrolase family protein n=1 Tax=Nocardia callitridis TaxID=648753 RepID=A0ABP9KWD9_9NOCA
MRRGVCLVAALTATLAVAVTGLLPSTATAAKSEGKSLVTLGDSFAANGLRWESTDPNCAHGPSSWPTQLGQRMGLADNDIADVTCPGSTIDSGVGWWLVHETRAADKQGAFGPKTRLVTIQTGMNDQWGSSTQSLYPALRTCVFDFTAGCGPEAAEQGRMTDYRGVSGTEYAERIREVVTYVRHFAPRARIVLVGYPELFPAGQDSVCVDVLGVGQVVQPRGEAVIEYLDRLDAAQRAAAALLRIDFFDTRAITEGHGLCSDQPWLNGVFDPRADFVGIPFHPSAHGDAVVADALYERFGR